MKHAVAMPTCRADRVPGWRWTRRLPFWAFALFGGGFVATTVYVHHLAAARSFARVQQFDLWAVLLGALVGLALSSSLYYVVWVAGVAKLCDDARRGATVAWLVVPVVVLATVFLMLFIGIDTAAPSLDRTVARDTRPITLLVAATQLPGLAAFLGLRQVATTDAWWTESGACTLRLIRRLRAELRRLLATLGSFLTLLVITVGMRRQAFLALDRHEAIPAEAVLLYGLLFAALMGAFYTIAASAIDARSNRILDTYAPLPDPTTPDFRDRVGLRATVAETLGNGGSWDTFQTTVVIAAPLLTALIGSAIGS